MRNLKKVLALVLALAMVMTMFAGAISFAPVEFSDADTLTTDAGKEAGKILSALGVFVGDAETAAIRGTASISRQEMAKVAMVLKTGSQDETFYTGATTIFTDNNGWGADFVNWAYYNGILSGDGKGLVRPWDNVTGVEAAKIFLTVLGYDAAEYGFINNANWKNNVLTVATRIGLLNNVVGSMDGDLSRENVMIMAANALYLTVNGTNKTLLNNTFGYTKITAVAVANENMGLTMAWKADSANQYNGYFASIGNGTATYNTTKKLGDTNYARFAYRDYVKTSAANELGYYTYKVITAPVAVANSELGTEYDLLVSGLNDVTYDSYEVRDVLVLDLSDSQNIVNGNGQVKKTAPAMYENKTKVTADGSVATTAPYITKDNNQDGTIDYIWYAKYALGIVTAANEDGTYSVSYLEKNTVFDKMSVANTAFTLVSETAPVAGEYVVTYADVDGVNYIKRLDVVSASVNGWNGKEGTDGSWTLSNGTSVGLAHSSIRTTSADLFFTDKQWTLSNTVYDFVLDGTKVVAVSTNTNTKFSDYAIVTAISINDIGKDSADELIMMTPPYVKLFTADNQYNVYPLASVNGVMVYNYITGNYNSIAGELSANKLVSYVVDNGSVHLMTAEYAAANNGYVGFWYAPNLEVTYKANINMWTQNGRLWDTNAATIFATNGTKWVAYGKDEFFTAGSDVTGTALEVLLSQGSVYADTRLVKAMSVSLDELPGTVLGAYGSIIISTGSTKWDYDDATDLYTYTTGTVAPHDGTATTLTFETYYPLSMLVEGATFNQLPAGKIYKINTNEKGVVVAIEEVTTAGMSEYVHISGSVNSFYVDDFGTSTLIVGETPVVLANDATIYTVQDLGTDDFTTYTYGDLIAAYNAAYLTGGKAPNVEIYAIYNAAGEVSTAIINVLVKTPVTTPAA